MAHFRAVAGIAIDGIPAMDRQWADDHAGCGPLLVSVIRPCRRSGYGPEVGQKFRLCGLLPTTLSFIFHSNLKTSMKPYALSSAFHSISNLMSANHASFKSNKEEFVLTGKPQQLSKLTRAPTYFWY